MRGAWVDICDHRKCCGELWHENDGQYRRCLRLAVSFANQNAHSLQLFTGAVATFFFRGLGKHDFLQLWGRHFCMKNTFFGDIWGRDLPPCSRWLRKSPNVTKPFKVTFPNLSPPPTGPSPTYWMWKYLFLSKCRKISFHAWQIFWLYTRSYVWKNTCPESPYKYNSISGRISGETPRTTPKLPRK
jgi:hypothetical protein